MREQTINFSCRCGRRLTAVIYTNPPAIQFMDHGKRLEQKRCPTPGCRHDYSRMTVDEFKENVFSCF